MRVKAIQSGLLLCVSVVLLPAADLTYSKDVAPIFFERCTVCHHPNDIAPMSLMTYRDTRPWAKAIRDAVLTKKMPPWFADSHYGTFENNPGLSQEEIDRIVAWVDQGAKEGDPKDLPAPPKFTDGWRIGTPDLIIQIPDEQTIAANAPDDYKIVVSTAEFKEDVWVKAVELRPGNGRRFRPHRDDHVFRRHLFRPLFSTDFHPVRREKLCRSHLVLHLVLAKQVRNSLRELVRNRPAAPDDLPKINLNVRHRHAVIARLRL